MEQIISKLLRDFEDGKMNRRQLIQSLAVAASAAAAVSPAAGQEAKGKSFKAVTVNHISYQVQDYAKTRDFYADLFGMEVKQDNGRTQCYLAFGNTFLLPRNGRPGPDGKVTPLVDHIAYTIEDWDKSKVEAELKRRKLNFAPRFPDGPRPDTEDSFHVKDPDGFDLQISGKDMKA
jgi:catechol 2,3-dioxygenase-like lactoylglutathione lyase family enzyme